MKYSGILLFCLLAAGLAGCMDFRGCRDRGVKGSGVELTETRDLEAFSAVAFSGAFQVSARCGAERSFIITGDDNIVPLVITEIRGSKLHVYTEGNTSPRIPLSVVLSCANLAEVTGAGVLDLELSGVDNSALAIGLSGTGSVDADGKTSNLTVRVSGSGSISASGLTAEDVSVTLSGTGSAAVHASRTLQVEINGTGSVRYSGEPDKVNQRISGMGTVSSD